MLTIFKQQYFLLNDRIYDANPMDFHSYGTARILGFEYVGTGWKSSGCRTFVFTTYLLYFFFFSARVQKVRRGGMRGRKGLCQRRGWDDRMTQKRVWHHRRPGWRGCRLRGWDKRRRRRSLCPWWVELVQTVSPAASLGKGFPSKINWI